MVVPSPNEMARLLLEERDRRRRRLLVRTRSEAAAEERRQQQRRRDRLETHRRLVDKERELKALEKEYVECLEQMDDDHVHLHNNVPKTKEIDRTRLVAAEQRGRAALAEERLRRRLEERRRTGPHLLRQGALRAEKLHWANLKRLRETRGTQRPPKSRSMPISERVPRLNTTAVDGHLRLREKRVVKKSDKAVNTSWKRDNLLPTINEEEEENDVDVYEDRKSSSRSQDSEVRLVEETSCAQSSYCSSLFRPEVTEAAMLPSLQSNSHPEGVSDDEEAIRLYNVAKLQRELLSTTTSTTSTSRSKVKGRSERRIKQDRESSKVRVRVQVEEVSTLQSSTSSSDLQRNVQELMASLTTTSTTDTSCSTDYESIRSLISELKSSSSSGEVSLRLQFYIEKLLEMRREEIDQLSLLTSSTSSSSRSVECSSAFMFRDQGGSSSTSSQMDRSDRVAQERRRFELSLQSLRQSVAQETRVIEAALDRRRSMKSKERPKDVSKEPETSKENEKLIDEMDDGLGKTHQRQVTSRNERQVRSDSAFQDLTNISSLEISSISSDGLEETCAEDDTLTKLSSLGLSSSSGNDDSIRRLSNTKGKSST